MIVCTGDMEQFDFAKSIGVGMINSAIHLSNICEKCAVDSIVFMGSAGSYTDELKIGDIIVSDSAAQIELSFLDKSSYTPIDNCIGSGLFDVKDSTLQIVSYETKQKYGIINSSNYITTNYKLASRLNNAKILAENMEFYSVMSVAKYFEIPCFGIFCITNYCNENAHEDFLKNIAMAKRRLTEHLEQNMWIRTYGNKSRII